jgi:hypothetical protein
MVDKLFNIDVDKLGPTIKVYALADMLGVSIPTAYSIARSPGFPSIEVPGCSRVIIPTKAFLTWLENQINKQK